MDRNKTEPLTKKLAEIQNLTLEIYYYFYLTPVND
jgi:hypothetical protein